MVIGFKIRQPFEKIWPRKFSNISQNPLLESSWILSVSGKANVENVIQAPWSSFSAYLITRCRWQRACQQSHEKDYAVNRILMGNDTVMQNFDVSSVNVDYSTIFTWMCGGMSQGWY